MQKNISFLLILLLSSFPFQKFFITESIFSNCLAMAKELALKAQMNDEINKFSVVRNQLKKIINARNQLEVQLNENKLVKEVCCCDTLDMASLEINT